jgi:hypothetical protein
VRRTKTIAGVSIERLDGYSPFRWLVLVGDGGYAYARSQSGVDALHIALCYIYDRASRGGGRATATRAEHDLRFEMDRVFPGILKGR